jgi:hypothetical protein
MALTFWAVAFLANKNHSIMSTPQIKYCLGLLLFIAFFSINAQSIQTQISEISNLLQTVQASKSTLSQSLKGIGSDYVELEITEIDTKGREERVKYQFSFADIDINTVRSVTKKELIQIQLLVKSKQKLIKKIEVGGDKTSYIDETQIYAQDIENAREIVEAVKNTIPISESIEDKKLSLNTYKDHLNWLKENVNDVDYPDTQYVQFLSNDSKENGYATLVVKEQAKNKLLENTYQFNFSLLNQNSVDFGIKGDEFYIEVSTRRGVKAIKTFEGNVQDNYNNSIKFYSNTIENGKQIYRVLKAIIPLAEEAFKKNSPNFSSRAKAVDYLNGVISAINTENESITQTITDACVSTFERTSQSDKDTESHSYVFNFIDINPNTLDFDAQRDLLFIELNTNKESKFIKHTENGELKNYESGFKIYVNSVEEAINGLEAIKKINETCKNKTSNNSELSENEAIKKLSEIIGVVSINEDTYDQTLEILDAKTNQLKLTRIFSDTKKSKEEIYEFGYKDLNNKSIEMQTKGKNVQVIFASKYLEKIIKTYVDGEIKNYSNKITIEAKSVENAREIVALLKAITDNN